MGEFFNSICNSTDAGVLYTAAAGNNGWDWGAPPPDVPAWFPEVLTGQLVTLRRHVPHNLDAFTSREQVCYTARVLSEHLAQAVDAPCARCNCSAPLCTSLPARWSAAVVRRPLSRCFRC